MVSEIKILESITNKKESFNYYEMIPHIIPDFQLHKMELNFLEAVTIPIDKPTEKYVKSAIEYMENLGDLSKINSL